ncbi:uncharacterized protein LOC123875636 [Maniola jurtina]|uniref:uncharacterized protein LOC123875636 n=1 Tax=Maniola jurtina TaxID=191418 RepID=UPI001E68A495|nr:uncharacterized protein LOC123875636 [Maniola jurtina]
MKIIFLFAFFALVSTKALDQSVLENQSLQDFYDCRPGEKCADKLVSASDNFPEAVEKACPKCSSEQKSKMAAFVDAISKGVSLEEAKKLYNPDNKYFDIVDNPNTSFTFDATVSAS